LSLALGLTVIAHPESFPSDAGIVNVKDYGAAGDGVTDDTAAINRAIADSTPGITTGFYAGQAKIVYFPNGTYIISAPLVKNDSSGNPTYGMVLIGESRTTTTLRLATAAPGFGDPSNPLGMIYPTSDAAVGWSPGNGNGNAAYQNTIQDMTIDIGTGNPGAIGIDYLANNLGAIRNVTVHAPSGTAGVTGIRMTRPVMGPALLEGVLVSGFPIGLDIGNLHYSLTLDFVTLRGQTVAAIRNTGNQIAANALTTKTAGPAIVNATADGEIVLTGSSLNRGASNTGSLIANQGTIVFRNRNTVDGYQSFTGSDLPGDVVNGLLTPAGFSNGAGGNFNTITPILNPPSAISEPASAWVSVAAFGATPSADFTDLQDHTAAIQDASAGVQAAMNSGAATIYFPHGVYYLARPVTIPPTVQRIVGMDSTIHPMQDWNWRTEGMLRIVADASRPLVIEHFRFDDSNDGGQLALEQSSSRTVVLRDLSFAGAPPLTRTSSGGPLFLEDITGSSPMTIAGKAAFQARQFDLENCQTCVFVDQATTVILGFKEEGDVTEVAASNGAQVDMLGGLAYMVHHDTDAATPLFLADGSSRINASFAETTNGSCCTIADYLSVEADGQVSLTPANNFPSRSDQGHVVGMLWTGAAIVGPSSVQVAAAGTVAIPAVTVTDALPQNLAGELTVSVSAGSGTLSMSGSGGTPLPGSGTNAIQLAGSVSQVNAALATLAYTAASSPSTDTVAASVTDQTGSVSTSNSFLVVGAPQVELSATGLSFANQQIGSTAAAQVVTLTNNGPTSLEISGVGIAGAGAAGFLETNTCGAQVAANSSCAFAVSFKPASATGYSATLSVFDSGGNSPQAIALNGTGVPIMPVIFWREPGAISYGTALSTTQLDATANVPGSFTYTPGVGAVLSGGSQSLSVVFTPADSANFATATASVTLFVNKATPALSWAIPAAIEYGTALDAAQLNATASMPGILTYSPAAGKVLKAGTNKLSVTFTPIEAAGAASASLVNRYKSYTAIGDSIAAGCCTGPTGQKYVSLVGEGLGIKPTNLGVSGTTCADDSSYTFLQTVTNDNAQLFTFDPMINDLSISSAGVNGSAFLAQYTSCIMANDVYLATAATRVDGSTALWKGSQACPSWSASNLQDPWIPLADPNEGRAPSWEAMNATQGASCTVSVSGSAITIANEATASSSATADIYVDGNLTKTVKTTPYATAPTYAIANCSTSGTAPAQFVTCVYSGTGAAPVVGSGIVIQGENDATYNGEFFPTAVTANSVTFINNLATPGSSAGGTLGRNYAAMSSPKFGRTFIPQATQITGLSRGVHLVKIVIESAGTGNPFYLDYISGNAGAGERGGPVVVQQTGLRTLDISAPDTLTQPWAAEQEQVGSKLAGEGYSVVLADTRSAVGQRGNLPRVMWSETSDPTSTTDPSLTCTVTAGSNTLTGCTSTGAGAVLPVARGVIDDGGSLFPSCDPACTTIQTVSLPTIVLAQKVETVGIEAKGNGQTPGTYIVQSSGGGASRPAVVSIEVGGEGKCRKVTLIDQGQGFSSSPAFAMTGAGGSACTFSVAMSAPTGSGTELVRGFNPGVHPNDLGHRQMADAILDALRTFAIQSDYATVTASVNLTVMPVTPKITWNPPAAIAAGTVLGVSELNAKASVSGSFTYSPGAGTQLGAGTHTIVATFTPKDTADCATATAAVQVTVGNAPAAIATAPSNAADVSRRLSLRSMVGSADGRPGGNASSPAPMNEVRGAATGRM
jgi:lysophospholipase L1-like esterase